MKLSLILVVLVSFLSNAQDRGRFSDEVMTIQKKYDTLWDANRATIVFAGSSTIRKWTTVESDFPNHQIVNSGFGGSEASDLLGYTDELINRFSPEKVFIYEGDNDISSKKKPTQILGAIQAIITDVQTQNPGTKIVLISAKPSLSRWKFRKKYKQLNRKFITLSQNNPLVEYADVWTPMLDGRKVKKDIFVSDGLHMNSKGYQIWYNTLRKYVEN